VSLVSLAADHAIVNPYLGAFLAPPSAFELSEFAGYGNRQFQDDLVRMRRRQRLTHEYAWAIPTEPVVRTLATLSPICDLGCGTGYWANLLAQTGAQVIAVDAIPPRGDANRWHHTKEGATIQRWAPIITAAAEEFEVPIDAALMLCWPPYDSSMADVALRRYRGDRVIYVGEGCGGCTGDDAFHDRLVANWILVAEHQIPQWSGVHDSVSVYRRGPS
jgi:hypothetical protein